MLLCAWDILQGRDTAALGGKCRVRCKRLKNFRLPQGQKDMRLFLRVDNHEILDLGRCGPSATRVSLRLW